MKKIKWCVIGAGGIADRRTIPAILLNKNSELVALMDRTPEVAEKLGKKYNVKWYSDEESMLKENDCDCVYIGTPVACHYAQAMTALKYKRNVFVEKPVAINSAESEKLVNAFKKAGKQLTVGYMMKYHSLHEKARSIVSSDKIGKISSVRMQFSCWYPDISGAWRQSKSLGGGGALMDLGVHCIDLIEHILDEEIVKVKGLINTKSFHYEVEDGAVIVFETASGTLGHIDVNFNIPDNASESKLEIYGEKGYVICKGTLAQEEKGKLYYLYAPQGDYVAQQSRTVDKPKTYNGANGNLYLKQIRAFEKIIKTGKPDYTYTDRAVQVQKVVDAVYANKTEV